MAGGGSANITGILAHFHPPEEGYSQPPSLFARLASVLALLCRLFSLDMILLSGETVQNRGFVSAVREKLTDLLAPDTPPPIKVLQSPQGLSESMALKIRSRILGTA
jgi:hypothetical protein